ncbi:MAG: hypothetical protein ACLFUB_10630 [Cyclobacteriaceae bacterium]
MELINIERLLEKYWNGDTSLEEERQLQRFFSEEEVPEHLEGVATLFRTFSADWQFKQLDDDFDEALIHKIEKSEKRLSWRSWLSIAATVSLLIVSALWVKDMLPMQAQPPTAETQLIEEDTYEDPQLAYEQTREALLLISSMMNKGTQQVEKLEKFHEAQETVKPE